jgi:hypothetical protein
LAKVVLPDRNNQLNSHPLPYECFTGLHDLKAVRFFGGQTNVGKINNFFESLVEVLLSYIDGVTKNNLERAFVGDVIDNRTIFDGRNLKVGVCGSDHRGYFILPSTNASSAWRTKIPFAACSK